MTTQVAINDQMASVHSLLKLFSFVAPAPN